MTLEVFLILVIVLYLIIIGSLVYGFDKVDDFNLSDISPRTKFSIIIPFRNEANNLPNLLESLSKLNYPHSHFEVILVNDNSNDESVDIINQYLVKTESSFLKNTKIIDNVIQTNSPKKDAITLAIENASFDWIVTTDADCMVPRFWIDGFDQIIQSKEAIAIVGPVSYYSNSSFLHRFQTLEILALQGATIGGFGINKPIMCNGANFCYQKKLFVECGGFSGNDTIASGDDLFLLEKFQNRYQGKTEYLKSIKVCVKTKGEDSFSGLVNQRLRWAAKASNYSNWYSKLVGLIVLMGNLSFIALLPLFLLDFISSKVTIALMVIKVSIDFLLVFKSARFFLQENLLSSYVYSSILYPIFSVYIVLLSFIVPYKWKQRTFKK